MATLLVPATSVSTPNNVQSQSCGTDKPYWMLEERIAHDAHREASSQQRNLGDTDDYSTIYTSLGPTFPGYPSPEDCPTNNHDRSYEITSPYSGPETPSDVGMGLTPSVSSGLGTRPRGLYRATMAPVCIPALVPILRTVSFGP